MERYTDIDDEIESNSEEEVEVENTELENLPEEELDNSAEDQEESEIENQEETPAPYFELPPTGENADDAELRQLLGDTAYDALQRRLEDRISRQMQSAQAATMHVTAAAAKHPELFRQFGAAINQSLLQIPSDLRSKPEAVNIAVANLILQEAARTGDLGATLQKMAHLTGNNAFKTTEPPKAKTPIPATQRQPAGTVKGGTPQRELSTANRFSKRFPGVSARIVNELMEEI
jgi:hypothetical protein